MSNDRSSNERYATVPVAYERLMTAEQCLLSELELVNADDADELRAEMEWLQVTEQAQFGLGAVAVSLAVKRGGVIDHEQDRQFNHLEKLADSLESIALLRISRQLLGKKPQAFHEQTARAKVTDYMVEFRDHPDHVRFLHGLLVTDGND